MSSVWPIWVKTLSVIHSICSHLTIQPSVGHYDALPATGGNAIVPLLTCILGNVAIYFVFYPSTTPKMKMACAPDYSSQRWRRGLWQLKMSFPEVRLSLLSFYNSYKDVFFLFVRGTCGSVISQQCIISNRWLVVKQKGAQATAGYWKRRVWRQVASLSRL